MPVSEAIAVSHRFGGSTVSTPEGAIESKDELVNRLGDRLRELDEQHPSQTQTYVRSKFTLEAAA